MSTDICEYGSGVIVSLYGKKSLFSERLEKAIGIAAIAHNGQKRKGKAIIPYIAHPCNVGVILMNLGFDEYTVIAGILHDTIEDTKYMYDSIKKDFGKRVADLVKRVTNPEGASYDACKKFQKETLKDAPIEAKAIKVADLLHNTYSKVKAIHDGDTDIWKEFSFNRVKTLIEDRKLVASLKHGWDHPIFGLIIQYLSIIEKYN